MSHSQSTQGSVESKPASAIGTSDVFADVTVIGAGLAGTSTASALAQAGYSVALIDSNKVNLPEFRAEKLGEPQMQNFEKLGLGPTVRNLVTPFNDMRIYRFGRLFARESIPEYGFRYSSLVNGLRAAIPSGVQFLVGWVINVTTSSDMQSVTLADGRHIQSRLVVVATGLGDAVKSLLNIRKIETSKSHSLTMGFTLAKPASAYAFRSLTCYGRKISDRVAYLTMFPIDDIMRGNLFLYRLPNDPWVREFRLHPQQALKKLMPEISDICGDFEITGKVDVRPMDLSIAEDFKRDGLVLIGDAFATTCPVTGTGILRSTTDVARLCVHVPRWLATPGMSQQKIDEYYNDDIKTAMDASSTASSWRARHITTEAALQWSLLRWRNAAARLAFYGVKSVFHLLPSGANVVRKSA